MKIENFDLNNKILLIAEIGNNHEGNLSLAEDLIGLAAKSGADVVKFQTIIPEKLVSSDQADRIRQLKKFQLKYEDFERLKKVADREKILFMSTPFDLESVRFLNPIVPAFKIASGDNNFFPLIDEVCATGKPIILSSGLTDLESIRETKQFVEAAWKKRNIVQDLAILHCVTSYPTVPSEANLLAMRQLAELGVTVGYSDHTIGIEAAVLSVALGARIIEKHFTISKTHSEFRDHQLSSDPAELSELVKRIRQTQELLGDGIKRIQSSEKEILQKVRRSIAASKTIESGQVLTWDDLSWVRPQDGLLPGQENQLVGRRLRKAVGPGELIQAKDVE